MAQVTYGEMPWIGQRKKNEKEMKLKHNAVMIRKAKLISQCEWFTF